jgi:hypothetical protein
MGRFAQRPRQQGSMGNDAERGAVGPERGMVPAGRGMVRARRGMVRARRGMVRGVLARCPQLVRCLTKQRALPSTHYPLGAQQQRARR